MLNSNKTVLSNSWLNIKTGKYAKEIQYREIDIEDAATGIVYLELKTQRYTAILDVYQEYRRANPNLPLPQTYNYGELSAPTLKSLLRKINFNLGIKS